RAAGPPGPGAARPRRGRGPRRPSAVAPRGAAPAPPAGPRRHCVQARGGIRRMLGGRPDNLTPRPGVPAPVVGDDPADSGQITGQRAPRRGGRPGRGDQQDRRAVAVLLVVEVASPGLDESPSPPLLFSFGPRPPAPKPLTPPTPYTRHPP